MFESKDFREALGRFATGVTIVTAADREGAPVGVTVSSYNSVSLDPPLVLWSLAKTSRSLEAFREAKAYVIHVLGRHQQDLALHFAKAGTDKFSGLELDRNGEGAPLIADCAAHFECVPVHMYDGGDHVIFVGEVLRFDKRDVAPLLFHRGQFAGLRDKPQSNDESASKFGRYTEDFLPYLLAQARAQLQHPVRIFRQGLGMSESQYGIMGMLNLFGTVSGKDIFEQSWMLGRPDSIEQDLEDMRASGWVELDAAGWRLTQGGRSVFLSVLSMLRAREEDVLAGFDAEQVEEVKSFLRALIARTRNDVTGSRSNL